MHACLPLITYMFMQIEDKQHRFKALAAGCCADSPKIMLFAVGEDNLIYKRSGISSSSPEGLHWSVIDRIMATSKYIIVF